MVRHTTMVGSMGVLRIRDRGRGMLSCSRVECRCTIE